MSKRIEQEEKMLKSKTLRVGKKDGTEKVVLGKEKVKKTHSTVGASVGLTINLGNYSSAKVSASIEMPCKVGQEKEKFVDCWKMVEGEIMREAKEFVDKTKTEVK